jgi:hypothetical protein
MINKIQQLIGFVLLMILVMGMTIAPSHRNRVSSPPATIPTAELVSEFSPRKTEEAPKPPETSSPIDFPQISAKRIFTDLENLAFERYSESRTQPIPHFLLPTS